jgi:heptosyltransferase-2
VKRILIIQTAFLGDVILATPVFSELKRLFPEAKIDALVKAGNESLLESHQAINEVFTFSKKEGKWKSLIALIRSIRKRKYDAVINLHRFGSSGLITALSGANETRGFAKNPFSIFFTNRFPHEIGNGTHEVERNLSLINDLGAAKRVRPSLFPTPEDFAVVKAYKEDRYAVIAPASVWFTKQLPKEQWVRLIHQLNSKVYLIGAPSDEDLCTEIMGELPEKDIVNLAGKLTLMQSAALISSAQRTYVNDSGPLHIASAMNAPVTAFFCSTVPEFGFGPLSDDAKIIQIEEKLACRPCGLHGHAACPKGHFKCGNAISIRPEAL